MSLTKLAIVGVGKIARDQHIPAIEASPNFSLAATVSGSGGVDGVENHDSIEDLVAARPDIRTLVLTMPPVPRFDAARAAILAGCDVMLEKPPGVTLSEVRELVDLARDKGVAMLGSWHLRHALAVRHAREWLAGARVTGGHITWKENVRVWHPGQQWIWEPGGMGVFDTGINALSIMTDILPVPVHLTEGTLFFPENRQAPIAADLTYSGADGLKITADMDWRLEETSLWDMEYATDKGLLTLRGGASSWQVDGVDQDNDGDGEYPGVYRQFADVLRRREIVVDDRPLAHVADAFMLSRRETVAAFEDRD